VKQVYTTTFNLSNTETLAEEWPDSYVWIADHYSFLPDIASGSWEFSGKPDLNCDKIGDQKLLTEISESRFYERGFYTTTIFTPIEDFPFGEDLIVNTEVSMNNGYSTNKQNFSNTFRFDYELPAPQIISPTNGEMLHIDRSFFFIGQSLPDTEIEIYNASTDELIPVGNFNMDEMGRFFGTIPAGRNEGETLSFYAVAAYHGLRSQHTPTVSLTESTHCWCPQRSTWKGAGYTYPFKNKDTGLISTDNWEMPGALGFRNSIVTIYAGTETPEEIYIIADGRKYLPESQNGNLFTFKIQSAHTVNVHVECVKGQEKPLDAPGIILVDPDGYVYDAAEGWGQVVPGAVVTCMEYVNETDRWREWPAYLDIYENQENPQTVGTDGYFAFFTPPGTYYLQVENPAPYQSWRSEDLEVITEIVHRNVPYTSLPEAEPMHVIEASTEGLKGSAGEDLTEVQINTGQVVEWISEVPEASTFNQIFARGIHPEIHIQSVIDPEQDRKGFDSGMLEPFAVYRCQFDYPGEYEYYYIHGDTVNKGKIIVIGGDPGPDTQIPTTPEDMTAGLAGSNSVVLNWTASEDDTGVTEYYIYRCSEDEDHFTKIGTTAANTYNDINLLYNTYYQYFVIAADAAMNISRNSDTAIISTGDRPPVPDSPQDEDTEEELPPGVSPFSDIGSHWASESIIMLNVQGVILGYPDGSFKPDHPITRAEFITMLARALEYDLDSGIAFDDTEGHWARDYITAARNRNIISGYNDNDNEFGPDQMITREEMLKIISLALGLPEEDSGSGFTDEADFSEWARKYAAAAKTNGIIRGYPDGSFKPKAYLTRAEAAIVIVNALNYLTLMR
ncbi:MAG: S-layer homology domain-containing protein, partial [Eubacteriales bacterium]|nr:S-layer homology domain-containing protein [Eubacteriales bacterium]